MLLMMKRTLRIFIKSTPTASIVPVLLFYISRSRWMGDVGFEGQRVTTPKLQFVQERVVYI